MFELQISDVSQSDMEALKLRLSKEVMACKGVFLFDEENGRKRINLAVPDKLKDYMLARVREEIVEQLAVEYKYNYFVNNLNIPMLDDFLKTAFLSSLAVFDKQTDKKYIEQQLFFESEVNLDSVFAFKLQLLKERWDEIVELVKNNFSELAPGGGMIEMMKFLIESSPVESDEVWAQCLQNHFAICNAKKEVQFVFEKSDVGFKQLIHRLVLLSPKRVVVASEGLDRLSEVFESRMIVQQKF